MIISFLTNKNSGHSDSGYTITTKAVTLSDKAEVLQAPENEAWDEVSINAVNVYEDGYTSGYTDGYADGYSSGSSSSIGSLVADFTGVGFKLPFAPGTYFEFDFLCPIFDGEHSGDTLFVASHGGHGSGGADDGGPSLICKYDTRTVGNVGKNIVTSQHFDLTQMGYGYKEFIVKAGNYTPPSASTQPYNVFCEVPGQKYIAMANGMHTADSTLWLGMFAKKLVDTNTIEPGTLPRYFKSLKVTNGDQGPESLISDIRPRRDGKMWDMVTNQEANIIWEKYDGTYPTTFTMLNEYDV